MKMCLLTGSAMRSRSGRFSSNFPPTTPGRALTMYFSIFIGVPQSFSHYLFHPLDDFRRLIDYLFGQSFQPLPADGIYFPLSLVCISNELRIFKHLRIGFAQHLNSIRRNPWSGQDGAAKGAGTQDDSSQTLVRLGYFLLLHHLPDRRRVWQSMISLVPRLHKKPHKAIFGPGSTGFTTKKSADRCAAAVNFVLFHSHIHVGCPRIPSDHVNLQAKNLLEQFRNIEARAANSRGTAARGFAGSAEIEQCLVRLIRA